MDTRRHILDAAERVIRARGLARATTRAIAREAGYAEGTLYNHFADKEDLFLAVLAQHLPDFVASFGPHRAGQDTVAANLEAIAQAALAFYEQIMALAAAIFAEPELLARHQAVMRGAEAGPQIAYAQIGAYLRAEQHLGRAGASADPQAAAALLLGACFQYVFLRRFLGEDPLPPAAEPYARTIVRTLLAGLSPPTAEESVTYEHA